MAKSKKEKPKIEDAINELLDSDNRINALHFVSYLRENKPAPIWVGESSWKILYKKTHIGFIGLPRKLPIHNPGERSWLIRLPTECDFLDDLVSKGMPIEIVWNNIRFCTNCCNLCGKSKKTVLGKIFDNMCSSWFGMLNPDIDNLEWAKRIIEYKKDIILNSTK